jgi:hypothetical protein
MHSTCHPQPNFHVLLKSNAFTGNVCQHSTNSPGCRQQPAREIGVPGGMDQTRFHVGSPIPKWAQNRAALGHNDPKQ